MKSNNKILSFCNIYIFLWIVYNLQETIFGTVGTLYSRMIVSFLLMVSFYYTLYAFRQYKVPLYMHGLVLFIGVLSFYGFLRLIGASNSEVTRVASYKYLFDLLISLLPVFPFYVFTMQGKLTRKSVVIWTAFFLVVLLAQYYQNERSVLAQYMAMGSDREEITNNSGYLFLSVIPLLIFWKKKPIFQYIALAYVMIFILMSMKRGAILIGAICVIVFILLNLGESSRSKKIGILILGAAIVALGYYAVQYMLENSDYFNKRLEEGAEGRGMMYSYLLNYFFNQDSIISLFFGNGADATLTISTNHAHHDWLELAICQGFWGIIVYVVYWVYFYKTVRQSRYNSDIHSALFLLFLINFIRSFFSMSYGDMSIYATLCIGYCMGELSLNKSRQYITSKLIKQ